MSDGIRRAWISGRAARWFAFVCAMALLYQVGQLLVRRVTTLPTGNGWIDGYVFIDAGRHLLHAPLHIYDETRVQLQLGTPRRAFIYPPGALLLFAPFGWLADLTSLATSAAVWVLVDAAALTAALLIIGRRLLRVGWTTLAPTGLLIFCLSPTIGELESGQVNGIILLLIALSLIRYPRTWSTGLLLGLACAVKPVAPLLLIIPALRGQWRVSAVALGVAAAVNLPLVPLLGWNNVTFYLLRFLPSMSSFVTQDINNLSLGNFINTWIGGVPFFRRETASLSWIHLPGLAIVVLDGIRLGLIGLAIRCGRVITEPVWSFSIVLALVPVLAGTAWIHYYIYTLPLLLCLVSRASLVGKAALLAAVAVVLTDGKFSTLWVPDILTSAWSPIGAWAFIHAQLVAPCVTVALIAVMVRYGFPQRYRPATGEEPISPSRQHPEPA